MRAYTLGVAAEAIGISDNELRSAVASDRSLATGGGVQGAERRIPYASVLRLAVATALREAVDVPYRAALRTADHLLAKPTGSIHRGPVQVTVDVAAIEASLAGRLAAAVESAIPRRRGRPPLPRVRR
jgi:hypothetical protein